MSKKELYLFMLKKTSYFLYNFKQKNLFFLYIDNY